MSNDGENSAKTPQAQPTPPNNPLDHNKIDVFSLYYLNSNDSPGSLITTVIFSGSNYGEWSRSLRLSLVSRRKWGLLDGSIVKPTNGSRILDWECVQGMLDGSIVKPTNGEQRDGLYYIRDVSLVLVCLSDGEDMVALWHKRLGHPSEKVVRSLPFIRSPSSTLNKACGMCHQAKHSRDSFPHSDLNLMFDEFKVSEMRPLKDNGTWELVALPPGKRALGSRWVYKVKYNSDGSLE
ncbi:hypothetical protein LIER_41421 [Lithospermum erythrorhizon]|uniref:Retrotransposon Copia-like N-terminal domain-containing protein n=1 Tax=Lithospermum erythrorhizon TaxID=34254 RepID=A0AAV3RAB3_LITER